MADIEYRVDDGIALIELARPEARNAQSAALLAELDDAWRAAAEDEAVRVIVLAAQGPHFSAGHDLREVPEGYRSERKGMVAAGHDWERRNYLERSRRWRDVPKPSIAAVQGACIAGGLMLAWPCDLILAAEDAYFSDPVVHLGIGAVEYLGHPWELGPRRAKEMLFTGAAVTAEEARERGMVNRIVSADALLDETMALARSIAEMDPWALAQAKRAVNQTMDIMGEYAALQAAFDIHWTGHGNAYTRSGRHLLGGLDALTGRSGTGDGHQ